MRKNRIEKQLERDGASRSRLLSSFDGSYTVSVPGLMLLKGAASTRTYWLVAEVRRTWAVVKMMGPLFEHYAMVS